jgi:hypothetical protein
MAGSGRPLASQVGRITRQRRSTCPFAPPSPPPRLHPLEFEPTRGPRDGRRPRTESVIQRSDRWGARLAAPRRGRESPRRPPRTALGRSTGLLACSGRRGSRSLQNCDKDDAAPLRRTRRRPASALFRVMRCSTPAIAGRAARWRSRNGDGRHTEPAGPGADRGDARAASLRDGAGPVAARDGDERHTDRPGPEQTAAMLVRTASGTAPSLRQVLAFETIRALQGDSRLGCGTRLGAVPAPVLERHLEEEESRLRRDPGPAGPECKE